MSSGHASLARVCSLSPGCLSVHCLHVLVASQACELVARQRAIGCSPLLSVNSLLATCLSASLMHSMLLPIAWLPVTCLLKLVIYWLREGWLLVPWPCYIATCQL